MIKPFRTFEFIARIKALLRRTGMQNGKKVKKGIKSGEYELDLQKQILQKDGVRIDLTRTEYQILCSLLANAPNLVARSSCWTLSGISMKIISMTIPCLYI